MNRGAALVASSILVLAAVVAVGIFVLRPQPEPAPTWADVQQQMVDDARDRRDLECEREARRAGAAPLAAWQQCQ